ncbi:MAG: hypothetical protein K2F78_01935, partial [Muribaculaceae bacterium]|nr:hypothetical protein [Muribaculaceae bacterium]
LHSTSRRQRQMVIRDSPTTPPTFVAGHTARRQATDTAHIRRRPQCPTAGLPRRRPTRSVCRAAN